MKQNDHRQKMFSGKIDKLNLDYPYGRTECIGRVHTAEFMLIGEINRQTSKIEIKQKFFRFYIFK